MTLAAATASAATATGLTASATTAKPAASTSALGSLAGNFQDFLTMLMTQLKHQDPTTPLDPNQFTSELVQFSSVEQQINTNASLGQLIQLTQSGQMLQSAAIVGHVVNVTSNEISLQNGLGRLNITAPTAERITVGVFDSTGASITQSSITAAQGSNNWSWDGKNAAGVQMPDGAYKVTVTATGKNALAVPFSVVGTATGVTQTSTGLALNIGAQTVPFSAVTAVAK